MVKVVFSKLRNLINKFKGGRNGILAFDFGSYSIKIAEIQIEKGNPVLTKFIQGRTYKNVIINGIINDP